MQRVWHGDKREENQDDSHWKGHKDACNNSGKCSARAGLEIFLPWAHDHGGCCHSERCTFVRVRIEKIRHKFWESKELLRRYRPSKCGATGDFPSPMDREENQ
ncbi:hypothetical protein ElyMa_002828700 [Elysia marginata]|uniref:Uncharacterized protein n=1 Tax=Elysia marginata TaxID=1093978 RepID=A0AAV4HV17_9GAST|nr:hypothetical protein ElyMa_002828700 [Elysia marginata]